jgi:hypothetical protein
VRDFRSSSFNARKLLISSAVNPSGREAMTPPRESLKAFTRPPRAVTIWAMKPPAFPKPSMTKVRSSKGLPETLSVSFNSHSKTIKPPRAVASSRT